MKYLNIKNLKEPGYYWWLPLCDIGKSDKDEYWTIINFHPMNDTRERSGVVFGPIVAPVCYDMNLSKHL